MKILIVHPCKGFYGGAEEVVTQLANYLYLQRHQVTVITHNAPAELSKKLQIVITLYNARNYIDMKQATQKALKEADVVNPHNFPATLAAFSTKKPIVWYCNEPPELFTNWKRRLLEMTNRKWVKKSAMKVVVADKFNADRFENIYNVKPQIVPYGIDYSFWSQGERTNSHGFTVLQIGTITPLKNQEDTIRAVAELKGLIQGLKLVLVGSINADREYYERMAQLASDLGVWDITNFTGNISQEQTRDWYFGSDLLVQPTKGQGGWLSPFEAICTGLPVVATTEFPAKAHLYEIGHPVCLPEPAEIAAAIQTIHDNYDSFVNVGKEYVRDNLSWKRFGENMARIFEESINE